ncbi:MAG: flagellar basal body rod protein FlgB [Acidobacteriota bacterium]
MLDPIAARLEQYMDLLGARQKLVASNIANADTPGYRTRDIDFANEFRSLLPGERPKVIEVPGLEIKHDGNNVSLDREARLLAENALRFNLAGTLIKGQLRMVRSAIEEGRAG